MSILILLENGHFTFEIANSRYPIRVILVSECNMETAYYDLGLLLGVRKPYGRIGSSLTWQKGQKRMKFQHMDQRVLID